VVVKRGLVRGVVVVLLGVDVVSSEWRVPAVVALGEIGCRYEKECFEKLDFLFMLVSESCLGRAGECCSVWGTLWGVGCVSCSDNNARFPLPIKSLDRSDLLEGAYRA